MRMCLEFTGFFLLISILSQVNGGKLLVSGSEKPPTLSEDMEAQNGELERRILIVEDEKKDSLNKIEQQKTQIKEDLEEKIFGLEIEMIQMKEELKQKLYEAQTKCQGEKDALDQEQTEALFANTSLTTNLINSNRDTIEQQARIIQMQSKSISLLRPLLGSNPNKTDIPYFNKAEDGAILETSSCGCLPRATQPTSLMPSRIEYLCEGEGNRSYSWECESGVCGTEEFPSCEETVLWENETVLWDNCQEVNFNGITHLCGEGSMEERKTKTIGAGLMTEVVSTPCGDCGDLSTALDWQPWGSCMDGEGNVDRPDIQCRKRGNGKIGFQEEERVIDGEWGSWGSCNKGSETCGEGIRKRKCNNPPPKNGGNDCVGENEENCEIAKCPIDGVWEAWGSCSKTCGTGKQTRKCKPPRYGGNDCVGENEQDCFVKHCPIDGGWGDWETCSETCGRGNQTRKCDKPPKQYGGNDCKGEDEQDCHIKYCPIDGEWGAWSTCSKTCGGGNQTRKCDNPPKQYGGNDCKGENEQDCNTNACPECSFKSLGCWKDTGNRAIATLEGTDSRLAGNYGSRQNALDICFQVAKSKGYPAFAVQDGGWCAGSSTALDTYKKYGKTTGCNEGKGGAWANDVYQITCDDPIYHVSGISTKQVTAKIGSTIWTDRSHSSDKAQYFITKVPDELVGSTLFQPTHYVAISTIQISSNQRAMIYVGVHESRDGGLMEELPKLGWKLENGWFIEWNRGIGARLQKIWSIQIEAGQSTTFTTTKDRMTFAIFVSEAEYKVSYRVSSSGEAGEYRSNQMGDYFPTGDNVNQFPIYRKGQEFLYVNTLESWMIGPKAGVATGWILNPKKNPTPSTPPVTGWKFGKSAGWKFWNDGTWQDDISLTVVPFFQ